MPDPKKIALLGATGSIGASTLEVIRRHPQRFELIAVAANRNEATLQAIVDEFKVPHHILCNHSGLDGLLEMATLPEVDIVVVATTGTIGVMPTVAALQAGKTVALANKETLVLAGRFVMNIAKQSKGRLLPVDSEHNAIFQCLDSGSPRSGLKRILLTASGGPFLHHTPRELKAVTLEQALRHPNWEMGPKVTIDSATMANKGLEMIEARWLFDLMPDQIEVAIHPQSLIHGMVEFLDGSVLALMAPPSMTFPIQHVLAYPERLEPCTQGLDFSRIHRLELRPPDLDKFPCLRLAREALEADGLAPALFTSANEVAVEAFIQNQIPFLAIPQLIEHCIQKADFPEPGSLQDMLDLEGEILKFARAQLGHFSHKATFSQS